MHLVFTCEHRLRYSRERASQKFGGDSICSSCHSLRSPRWCRRSARPLSRGEPLPLRHSRSVPRTRTWEANNDFSELELRTSKFQNLNLRTCELANFFELTNFAVRARFFSKKKKKKEGKKIFAVPSSSNFQKIKCCIL